LKQTVLFM